MSDKQCTYMAEKRISVRIPDEIYEALEKESHATNTNISKIVREVLGNEFCEGEDFIPVVESFTYKRIFDKTTGEVPWQFGVTKDGEEIKLGPFYTTDICNFFKELPDLLTIHEVLEVLDTLLESLDRLEETNKDLEEFWEEIARRRDGLKELMDRTRRLFPERDQILQTVEDEE